MAKCKAHGTEIGTYYTLTGAKRYMSDGAILTNIGFGWKLGGKVKAELEHLTPRQLYDRQLQHGKDWEHRQPYAASYKKQLHALCGLSQRWRLHAAVSLMPDDPDGVWSECCDGYGDNVHADLDDIVQLCAAYRLVLLAEKLRRETDAA